MAEVRLAVCSFESAFLFKKTLLIYCHVSLFCSDERLTFETAAFCPTSMCTKKVVKNAV